MFEENIVTIKKTIICKIKKIINKLIKKQYLMN